MILYLEMIIVMMATKNANTKNERVNNLLDITNEFEPSIPGRICFLGIKYNLNRI